MRKALFLAVASAFVLAGCQTPVTETPDTEIDNTVTMDRAHNRDDSALYTEASVGGAAFRQEGQAHVLFNHHHTGVAIQKSEKAAVSESECNCCAECECPEVQDDNCPWAGPQKDAAKKKDQSIYAKDCPYKAKSSKNEDRSIYAKECPYKARTMQKKDQSVYAK